MASDNGSRTTNAQNDNANVNREFKPILYNFRVSPPPRSNKTYALQQPFATLFDNLITVLWSVYSKKSKIQIGVNQLQWALDFLKCMKLNYAYPESIERIVEHLEDQLIEIYAKIGKKIQENKQKKQLEEMEREKNQEQSSPISGEEKLSSEMYVSHNEEDILNKIDKLKVSLNPISGEAKNLKDLNSLGRKKPKNQDSCDDKKHYVIDALQKILSKTTESETKTGVEKIIKELKVEMSPKKIG